MSANKAAPRRKFLRLNRRFGISPRTIRASGYAATGDYHRLAIGTRDLTPAPDRTLGTPGTDVASTPPASRDRLGFYIDVPYRRGVLDGQPRIYSGGVGLGFMRFAAAVGAQFSSFSLISRASEDESATTHPLPPNVRLIGLPHYPSLRSLRAFVRVLPATVAAMWAAAGELDLIWVTGVHPLGLIMAVIAKLRRRRVALVIRHDAPGYYRSRLPSRFWLPLLIPLGALNKIFRLMGRRLPTVVTGDEVAGHYRAPRPNVLNMRVTLLERSQLALVPGGGKWDEPIRLLTVGRIAVEKNPLLAVEMLRLLERDHPGRFELTWVGEGPLEGEFRAAAERAGVSGILRTPGFVAFGPALLKHYEEADAFVHTALTEGMPAVLWEAMGAGLPIVATDVGGISAALSGGDGPGGLTVPPADAEALAAALTRLAEQPELRSSLAGRALALANEATIETESLRVARFLAGEPQAGRSV